MREREHERFEIRFVDLEQRLFVLVTSDREFYSASLIRDMLRNERGGDWIILDHVTGRVVSDTRTCDFPISEESVETEAPSIASGHGQSARDATALSRSEASPARPAKPTSRKRAAVNVDD